MATSSPMAVWMMTSRGGGQIYTLQHADNIPGVLTDILLLITEQLDDTGTKLVVGKLDIIFGVTIVLHQGKEVIIGDVQLPKSLVPACAGSKRKWATHKLVLLAGDVGDVHVVGGGGQILQLLASEDINGDDVDLGVTVLASLGGRHVDDLARAALDDNVTVLPQSRALHGEGGRGAGIGGLKGNVVLYSMC